jgi:hypothetical protein
MNQLGFNIDKCLWKVELCSKKPCPSGANQVVAISIDGKELLQKLLPKSIYFPDDLIYRFVDVLFLQISLALLNRRNANFKGLIKVAQIIKAFSAKIRQKLFILLA